MTITMERFAELAVKWHKPPRVIFDVGSMNGADAEYLKRVFPRARVHGFEGHPGEWKAVTPAIDGWHNRLLWSDNRNISFFPKELGTGIHSIRDRGATYGTEMRMLKAYRMDCLPDIPAPDMVKLDVEGCALDVLLGFGDLLDGVQVLHVETESRELFKGQALTEDVYALLWDNGMDLIEHDFCCVHQYDGVWARR